MMGFGLGGFFLMIFFWIALIALAIWIVRIIFEDMSQPPNSTENNGTSAKEILDRRYAQGELSHDEYERMKKDLA